MTDIPAWKFHIQRAGRSDWPSNVERFSPWLEPRVVKTQEIWFIWRGQGTVTKNERTFPICQSNLFWFHSGERYSVRQNPNKPLGITYIVFDLLSAQNRPLKRIVQPLPDLIEEVEANLGDSITRRIVELLWESYIDHQVRKNFEDDDAASPFFTDEDEMTRSNSFAPMPISINAPANLKKHPALRSADSLFRAFITEILHQVNRDKDEGVTGLEKYQRKAVSKVAMRMQDEPKTVTSINDLAAAVGYSTDHFTRTFKKIMGCSPQQFLVNARIEKAKHLLFDSDLSVKEIAGELGYCNAYFFSRQFKNMTGRTPSDYRGDRSAASK